MAADDDLIAMDGKALDSLLIVSARSTERRLCRATVIVGVANDINDLAC